MDEVKARFGGCCNGTKKGEGILKVRTQEESIFAYYLCKKKAKRASRRSTGQFEKVIRRLSFSPSSRDNKEGETENDVVREPGRKSSKPAVRFFDVEVREYPVTASDNPCVRSGAALEVRSGAPFPGADQEISDQRCPLSPVT